MRRDRFYRGKKNNRGRGGRGDGGYRGRGRPRGRGGRQHHGRGGGSRRRSADSGNQRERIAIESGFLVLIDQFMLANPQFIDAMLEVMDEDPSAKDEIISRYGGGVVELTPDTYRIDRDPYKFSIVIHRSGNRPDIDSLMEQAQDEKGHVYIDTRCLAMIDRELLDDNALLQKYQQLWFSGQDKACRDLLRDNGGAVRYGFQRYGDELGIFSIPDEDTVALWPDLSEAVTEGESEESAAEA